MEQEKGGGLNILALEPYYAGSHRAFIDTLIRHSRHRFRLLTLPGRKWKWRMRGAAIWFARELAAAPRSDIDLIFATDMMSVADLRALLPPTLRACPVVCYFHENQLTYPLPDAADRDYQYGFTNITSCLASDAVWFNSETHRAAFLESAASLLRKMPDRVPDGVLECIVRKSLACLPLVEAPPNAPPGRTSGRPRTILWNHRWEYDKNPEALFEVLSRLNADGVEFRLAILGESFREIPSVFKRIIERLESRIVHMGHAEDRADYWRVLRAADIVVSTAIQENFGISIVEAILSGCVPLLPNRLSYPEIIPTALHGEYLYADPAELHSRLSLLLIPEQPLAVDHELIDGLASTCVADRCIARYDDLFESMGWIG